uniref:DUF4817 domain-containing protein n=1 Tax=Cacopsylla melanoneura TaxID=428564 RepID=A0A8D8WEY8_9HEMI
MYRSNDPIGFLSHFFRSQYYLNPKFEICDLNTCRTCTDKSWNTLFLTNSRSVTLTQRALHRRFPGRKTPTAKTLRRFAACLEETGSTRDQTSLGRPRTGRTAENNISIVTADVQEHPETTTRR